MILLTKKPINKSCRSSDQKNNKETFNSIGSVFISAADLWAARIIHGARLANNPVTQTYQTYDFADTASPIRIVINKGTNIIEIKIDLNKYTTSRKMFCISPFTKNHMS